MTADELTSIFDSLGAEDPRGWAESQINEGIPQLTRYLFLKGCWDNVVSDSDVTWIARMQGAYPENSNESYAGVAHALRRLLKQGAEPSDIAEVVRGMQAQLIFDICYQLSDPTSVAGNTDTLWGLFELDDSFEPAHSIDSLHESVLETDPTHREVRPRS